MKTSFLTMLAAGLLSASTGFAGTPAPPLPPPPAPANEAGFFVGAKGGFFWLMDESIQQGSLGADVSFKTGWGITVPVGYDFGNGFSVAFTAGYYDAQIDSVSVTSGGFHGSTSASGEVQLVPLMANASYDLKLADKLHWYLGAGLGTVYDKASLDSAGGHHIGFEDTSWNFGFQVFTGLRYQIAPNTSVNLGYRFLHVNNSGSGDDLNGNALEVGVMWKF